MRKQSSIRVDATRTYTVILEPAEEGGFIVHVPALPEVVTEGDSEAEALAMAKDAVHMGPLGYLVPLYNPVRLTQEICMLDHLSRGRMEIGVGRGISALELSFYNVAAHGVPKEPENFLHRPQQPVPGLALFRVAQGEDVVQIADITDDDAYRRRANTSL